MQTANWGLGEAHTLAVSSSDNLHPTSCKKKPSKFTWVTMMPCSLFSTNNSNPTGIMAFTVFFFIVFNKAVFACGCCFISDNHINAHPTKPRVKPSKTCTQSIRVNVVTSGLLHICLVETLLLVVYWRLQSSEEKNASIEESLVGLCWAHLWSLLLANCSHQNKQCTHIQTG